MLILVLQGLATETNIQDVCKLCEHFLSLCFISRKSGAESRQAPCGSDATGNKAHPAVMGMTEPGLCRRGSWESICRPGGCPRSHALPEFQQCQSWTCSLGPYRCSRVPKLRARVKFRHRMGAADTGLERRDGGRKSWRKRKEAGEEEGGSQTTLGSACLLLGVRGKGGC